MDTDLTQFAALCQAIHSVRDLLASCGQPTEVLDCRGRIGNRFYRRQYRFDHVLPKMVLYAHEFSDASIELTAMPIAVEKHGSFAEVAQSVEDV